MGLNATLRIGRMELDWSHKMSPQNHSKLFLPTDKKIAAYYYDNDVIEDKEAFVCVLKNCKGRLELMGFTLEYCKQEFEWLKSLEGEYYEKINLISFEQYAKALAAVDLSKLNPNFEDYGDFDYGEFVAKIVFQLDEFNKIIPLREIGKSEGIFFTNLSSYLNLRLLLENPLNQNQELVWCFLDGEAINEDLEKAKIYSGVDPVDKFLLVTEGSSDSFVIQKCFELLRPDISDFFYFIDMKENYPFTGVGNLFNFSKGLKAIGVLNKVIIIYDNDAEGVSKFEETLKLSLPQNMAVMTLPDLPEFQLFPTIGPSGISKENINGKAASIEVYLDIDQNSSFLPKVRWTNYVEKIQQYHGALERKNDYLKAFKSITKKSNYNFSKLEIVLASIYNEAIKILNSNTVISRKLDS